MSKEDIIRLALEAGFPAANYPSLVSDKEWEALERFFQAAYAAGVANRRPWVGLTEEQIENIWEGSTVPILRKEYINLARAIEAKLKEKNA